MFRELVLKEIRDNVRSLKFLLASLAIVLLVIASFQTMRADYHRRLARFSSANQDPSDVSIPPNPLSIFVKGRDELIGGSFRYKPTIGISGPNPMEDHAVGFIPTPDLLFVITVVMTLVALFFSFDLISGEREAGTLQLVLSNAISRDVVILGKTLAALVCILIPFIGSVLLEVILLMGDTRVPLSRIAPQVDGVQCETERESRRVVWRLLTGVTSSSLGFILFSATDPAVIESPVLS